MRKGQTVYTINAKTNEIDSWTYMGSMRTEKELLIQLTQGRDHCYIPARCVFESESEARFVADFYK